MAAPTEHWLPRALARAGVAAAAGVRVAPGSAIREVWEETVRATGLAEDAIVALAAGPLRVPAAQLDSRDAHASRLVPDRLARQHGVLPLRETDRQLVVATSDPMDFGAEQALSFASGRTVVFNLAGPVALDRALHTAYSGEGFLDELLNRVDDSMADAVRVVENLTPEDVTGTELQARPVVKLCNMILSEAIREEASDIHIEPTSSTGVVRFRVDGVLRQYMQLPLGALTRVVSRIKIMAEMDIADRIRPQDGRARIGVGTREYDLRVSTVPASGSEKVVIRVLYPKTADRLEDLKLPEQEARQVRRLLSNRDGIVIVTGPTGSGKTTTLYAGLRELATGKVNITTIEDPVEYELGGVTQIQVDPKRGVTFASALRAILRQDPDVVLVGEIRDLETAQVALQASLTGHLVLATLHTNDAPTAVTRLLDLGLDATNVAAALRGIVAQRLVRRVCPFCVQPTNGDLTGDERRMAQRYGAEPAVRAMGCDHCANTGYRGRLAVQEVLVSGGAVESAIGDSLPALEIRRIAAAGGMRSMLEVALEHVRSGATTLDEVERVLGEVQDDRPQASEPEPDDDRPHVLVVDDDDIVREITAETLEAAGMRVTQAQDGQEALDRLRVTPYQLVVLDLDMPRVDGITALQHIRGDVHTMALPVVVLTANREAEVLVMDTGADDYLPKPLDPARLLARVRAVLRRRSQG